jgi:hypothetical protein
MEGEDGEERSRMGNIRQKQVYIVTRNWNGEGMWVENVTDPKDGSSRMADSTRYLPKNIYKCDHHTQ